MEASLNNIILIAVIGYIKATSLAEPAASDIGYNDVTSGEKCSAINKRCELRLGCGMALHNFHVFCHSVADGYMQQCTGKCSRALEKLTRDDYGLGFTKCNCDGDTTCLERRRRLLRCQEFVVQKLLRANTTEDMTCSMARWLCETDPVCTSALEQYENVCASVTDIGNCTPSCKESLNTLLKQRTHTPNLTDCLSETYPGDKCLGMCIKMDGYRLSSHGDGAGHLVHCNSSSTTRAVCALTMLVVFVVITFTVYLYIVGRDRRNVNSWRP